MKLPALAELTNKYNALTLRERILIFAASAVVCFSLIDTFLIEPVLLKQKILRDQLAQQEKVVNQISFQIQAVMQENSPDSHSPIRMEINRLKQEIAEADLMLNDSRARLVQPNRMARHLQSILKNLPRLQLVDLKSLPVTGLDEETGEPDGKAEVKSRVYKHGVRLTLRGSYADLVQYMTRLEGMQQLMYWSNLDLKVVKYPVSEMSLVLYTLSLDRTWLQI